MSELQVAKIQKQRDRRKVRMKVSQTLNVGFQDFRKKKVKVLNVKLVKHQI